MNAKFLLIATVSTMLTAQAFGASMQRKNEKKLYVGSNSTEAIITYDGVVELDSKTKPTMKRMKEIVESQIEHTIGPMSVAEYTAVPKGDHTVSGVKVLSQNAGTYSIGYTFSGTMVLENGPKATYDIILAVNPERIYSAGMVKNVNPCTDEHYQSEGDFWYFWNPSNAGCKLKKGKDYTVVKAKVERFENTKKSYPEYHNLPDENGNINIHIFFGMDDNSKGRNPMTSGDTNAFIYRDFKTYLLENGYKAKKWTNAEVTEIAQTKNGALPYVETIQKGKLIYRFFFGPTAIDEDSLAFHWFYKDAIENSSVMLYGGHSGLGGHLDLASIEESLGTEIKFNKKKYQIFFFDSCTSYKYYNSQYFERKATTKDPYGTKKLDIFTNGLSTYFHVMPESNRAIAIAFEKALGYAEEGKGFVSYQTLAKQIDSDNLFGISGDEDNELPKQIK